MKRLTLQIISYAYGFRNKTIQDRATKHLIEVHQSTQPNPTRQDWPTGWYSLMSQFLDATVTIKETTQALRHMLSLPSDQTFALRRLPSTSAWAQRRAMRGF